MTRLKLRSWRRHQTDPVFMCFLSATTHSCCHLQRGVRSQQICPHTFCSGRSQTASEPASRWLIVKQTKATGRMAVKWEETLLARHAHKKRANTGVGIGPRHPSSTNPRLVATKAAFSWTGIKASSRENRGSDFK